MLLSFIVKFVLYLYLHCDKNENKQKEARFGPILKTKSLKYILQFFFSDDVRSSLDLLDRVIGEFDDGLLSSTESESPIARDQYYKTYFAITCYVYKVRCRILQTLQ